MAVKHVTRAHMGWTRLMFSAQKFFQLTPQQLRWRVSLLPFFRRGIREVELLAEDHEAGECWHQTLFTEETNIHSRSLLTGLPPGSQLVNLHSHFSSFPYYLGCVLANDTQAEVHKRVSEKLLAFLIKNLALYTFPRPLPSNGTVMPRTTWDSDKTKWYLKKPVMNSWVLHQSWTAYFQSFCFVGTIHLDYNLYPPRFPGSNGKESACNAGDPGSIPGLGRSPGGGHGNPLQPSCLENLRGQRSLAGYSSWGCKESDMTEQLTHTQCTCLQNPMDRGAWRATVHRVPKSQTSLKRLGTHARTASPTSKFLKTTMFFLPSNLDSFLCLEEFPTYPSDLSLNIISSGKPFLIFLHLLDKLCFPSIYSQKPILALYSHNHNYKQMSI